MTDQTDPNVLAPEWDFQMTAAPFGARASLVGARAGARELGATLYELLPGGAASPYHVHHGNEELLVVLSGRPALRTPEGRRELAAGAVVAFPRGPEGAHRVVNPGAEPARVLMISTMNLPEVAEHPDTGATLVMTGPGDDGPAPQGAVFPGGAGVPFMEAIARAMTEDPVR